MGNTVLLLQPNVDVASGSLVLYVGPDINASSTTATLPCDNSAASNQALLDAANPFGSGTVAIGYIGSDAENDSFSADGGWTLTFVGPALGNANIPAMLAFDASGLSAASTPGISYASATRPASAAVLTIAAASTALIGSSSSVAPTGGQINVSTYAGTASIGCTNGLGGSGSFPGFNTQDLGGNGWSTVQLIDGAAPISTLNATQSGGTSSVPEPSVDLTPLTMPWPNSGALGPGFSGSPVFTPGSDGSYASFTWSLVNGASGNSPNGGNLGIDGTYFAYDEDFPGDSNWTYSGTATVVGVGSVPGTDTSGTLMDDGLGDGGQVTWDGSISITFTPGTNPTNATFAFSIQSALPLTAHNVAPDGGTYGNIDGSGYWETASPAAWLMGPIGGEGTATANVVGSAPPEPTYDFSNLTISNANNQLWAPTIGWIAGVDQQDTCVYTANSGQVDFSINGGALSVGVPAAATSDGVQAELQSLPGYEEVTVSQSSSGLTYTIVITFTGVSGGVPAGVWDASSDESDPLEVAVIVTETVQTAGSGGGPIGRGISTGGGM